MRFSRSGAYFAPWPLLRLGVTDLDASSARLLSSAHQLLVEVVDLRAQGFEGRGSEPRLWL